MNNIVAKIGVRAAYRTALELYGTEERALEETAKQLCLSPEAVKEALEPETLSE